MIFIKVFFENISEESSNLHRQPLALTQLQFSELFLMMFLENFSF
jgi:hypothetical protein